MPHSSRTYCDEWVVAKDLRLLLSLPFLRTKTMPGAPSGSRGALWAGHRCHSERSALQRSRRTCFLQSLRLEWETRTQPRYTTAAQQLGQEDDITVLSLSLAD